MNLWVVGMGVVSKEGAAKKWDFTPLFAIP